MRDITKQATLAFKNYETFKQANTKVVINPLGGVSMMLHGNTIASLCGRVLVMRDCGYQTNTTKERLNGICTIFNINKYFKQIKGVWYFGHDVFNGEIKINLRGSK